MNLQKKRDRVYPSLISKWEPGRKSNRVRYDLFEREFLRYLKDQLDGKPSLEKKRLRRSRRRGMN
jgi:hypothetical protein